MACAPLLSSGSAFILLLLLLLLLLRTLPQALRGAMAEIESFYGPYNLMLERLVHPAFRWDRSTHELR